MDAVAPTVVAADDDRATRRLVAAALTPAVVRVLEARDGGEALELVR